MPHHHAHRTLAVAPDAPQSFVATASTTTAGENDLTWAAPASNGGSAITGYVIQRDGAQIATPAAGTTSYADTGLALGTAYSYTIAAVNAIGTGPTASSSATTANVPGGVTSHTSNYTQITWFFPTDGGSPITAYKVYAHSGTQLVVTLGPASNSYSNMSGKTLPWWVHAVNAIGEGTHANTVT